MAIIAWWHDHQFEVSPSVIRSFTDLQIRGSSETEEKTGGGEKYVAWKNTNPAELSMTVHLDARLGCDVRKEAMRFIMEARWGHSGYFYAYVNNSYSKLLLYKMMLTAANVTEVEMAPSGKWIRAEVQLTMKSCTVSDNNTGYWGRSGSSGGYSKTSVKSTAAATTKTAAKSGTSTRATVSTAIKKQAKAAAAAKKTTAAAKTVSNTGGAGKITAVNTAMTR